MAIFHLFLLDLVLWSRHLVFWSLGTLTGFSEILRQGTSCVKGSGVQGTTTRREANLAVVERKCSVPGSVGVAAADYDGELPVIAAVEAGKKTRLFCEEDEVVLYIQPGVPLVFFFRRGAAVRIFWFTSKGRGNEVSGDGKGGLGRERELLMRARHGAVNGKRGKERKKSAEIGRKCCSRLRTARGGHFEPLNGAVSSFFDPTRPFSGIKGFHVDMLVHVLSDLEATRVGKCVWKAATQAAF
ncbi:hypothetical protein NC652_040795 [Populus alba x Populus x berolinensis]|nr:hypothetical protein NC652_040795 [Populus alba x Populus x berolinensis]